MSSAITTLIFNLVAVLLSSTPAEGYSAHELKFINGHTYDIVIDQPFFRVKHDTHRPIPLDFKNESLFGVHQLPENDTFVEHDWTEREKKYLDCMDLLCVCPFFNGSVIDDVCVLPNGKELQKAIRREYRLLSDEERSQVENALNRMHADGTYNRLGRVHKYGGMHSGPSFFTWHREYMKKWEFIFRSYMPMGSNIGIPYWDSTADAVLPNEADSIWFSEYLSGGHDETGYVTRGAFANWTTMEGGHATKRLLGTVEGGELFSEARIDVLLDQKMIEGVLSPTLPLETCSILQKMQLDDRMLEYSHDYIHYYIGGDFEETYTSTNDPIFYFHHSFVDSIWEMWRQKIQTREEREREYPASDPNCFPENQFINGTLHELGNITNRDALSNKYTDNLYEYAFRPHCSARRPDCGSKFLFCDLHGAKRPRCLSKVKLGGNCTRFEHLPICYEGSCTEGRCKASSPGVITRLVQFLRRLFV